MRSAVLRAIPFIAALFFPLITLPRVNDLMAPFIERHLLFILSFAIFEILLLVIRRMQLRSKAIVAQRSIIRSFREVLLYAGICLLAITILVPIELLKRRLPTDISYLLYLAFAARALAFLCTRRNWIGYELILNGIALYLVTSLSFMLSILVWEWRSAILAAAITAAAHAPLFALVLSGGSLTVTVMRLRLLALLTLAAPLGIAALSYLHELPPIYLALLVATALLLSDLKAIREAETRLQLPSKVTSRLFYAAFLFFAILGILAVFSLQAIL
jgi:hypothetical protein